MSLKQKTIHGLLWSFIDRFVSQFITFIVGIVLARLLGPEEFGLIGMLTIFIGLSSVFIQSGFNQALIRKNDCTEKDYSTVFYFNLLASVVLYLILYFSSGLISDFYNEEELAELIKVLGVVLVFNSLTIVQRTKITKRVDFKLLTKISVITALGSGSIGIIFAATGFGVWSLVYKQLAQSIILGGLLWYWNEWRPKEKFSKSSFKDLFRFGSNLMTLGVIDIIYKNIYYVIIGKFYPAAQLGYYTRANQIKRLPSETLGSIIERVSFPVLSSIQGNRPLYDATFERLLRSTMLLSFVLLIGLAAIAKELTVVLMGNQWALAGEYLQILCFTVILYPLDKLLSSLLKVAGRSDLILKLGVIRKIIAIPVILTAIFYGIMPMLYVMIAHHLASVVLVSRYASRYAGLNTLSIFQIILPSFFISILMFVALILFGTYVEISLLAVLILKIIIGVGIVIGIFEAIRFNDYLYIKKEGKSKLMSYLSR